MPDQIKATTFPFLLHGGDYNPEQWIDTPGIWDEDLRLMNLARINALSVGIFSWASLEPEEGKFTFDWLDRVLDNLAANGQSFVLATPSGGKPNWLALKYEEVRRIGPNGLREPQHARHNHCPTSPKYREKVTEINTRLAERYGSHPGLLLWHLSNEYSGECHCSFCYAAFHRWLEARYKTPEAMNHAFWSKFWSHTYTSFDQVTAIDRSVHGLVLAWKRFHTDQLISFIQNEAAPLRRITPNIPITTNFMGHHDGYDLWKVAEHLDIVTWDNYPNWHGEKPEWKEAIEISLVHDIYRSMKGGQPWLLMESTPSSTNWRAISRPKRPGMHRLSSLQAVAHGSDGVMYFQYRKSRGSSEKFHGAVVDHQGNENARVFRDVAQVGVDLERLVGVTGGTTKAEVAVICDWQTGWAIDQAQGPRNQEKEYRETVTSHYAPFWKRGISTDVIDSVQPFEKYKLIIAPMLYMLRPGVAERLEEFVADGGVLVTTYLTGLTDEDDLCFLGGFPGPLRKLLGILVEETDVLYDHHVQTVLPTETNSLGLPACSNARHYCDIVHTEGAEVLAEYGLDFYAGTPAVTVNRFGNGSAYYVASRNDDAFLESFLSTIVKDLSIQPVLATELPEGVTVQRRTQNGIDYLFLMNFKPEDQMVGLPSGDYRDVLTDGLINGWISLSPFGVAVLVAET